MVWSPAGISCSIELSNHTLVPSTNTAPLSVDLVRSAANRSPVLAARVRATRPWDSPRTLMPREGTSFNMGHVVDVFCTQKATSGGSSDTGTKVLAAIPTLSSSIVAAIAMTPDGKCPNASLSDAGLRYARPLLISNSWETRSSAGLLSLQPYRG